MPLGLARVINGLESHLECGILINSIDFGRNNKVGVSDRAMVAFYNSDGVVSFYGDNLDLGSYSICKLSELLTSELLSGVRYNLIGRA